MISEYIPDEIIDFHVHIFPDKIAERAVENLNASHSGTPSTDGTLTGLLRQMQAQGVTGSVIQPVATKPEQVASINDWLLEIRSDKIHTFGSMHPGLNNIEEEMVRLKSNGFKGIKLQPDWIRLDLNKPEYDRIYKSAQELGIIILFHMGGEIAAVPTVHALPHMLSDVVLRYPDLKVIAAHMGGYMEWENVWDTLVGKDIYMDTSVCFSHLWKPSEFLRMIKEHGVEKILFASDNPMMEPRYPINQILGFDLSSDEKDLIFYKNAKRLLGII